MGENKWYKLAEIFAILSGTWIAASAMFWGMTMNNLQQAEAVFGLQLQSLGLATTTNNTLLSSALVNTSISMTNLSQAHTEMATVSVGIGSLFSFVAVSLGFLAFILWRKGSREQEAGECHDKY